MKTAIVHDLITTVGGADSTLESIYAIYPSPIYTLVSNTEAVKQSFFKDATIITSFIQRMPWSIKKYRSYLPLYPIAIEQFDLNDFKVILSSSFIVAKGLLSHTNQLHICYLHNPIRPAWELHQQFLAHKKNGKGLKGIFSRLIFHYLRLWDATSANRVDYFIANSNFTAKRINKLYGRPAVVIYPPVKTDAFPLEEVKENYYVTASRLVYHKRVDIIIKAFTSMPNKTLVIIGDGPEIDELRKSATPNIKILGHQPPDVLVKYLQKAKAFIFAANEDFGIAPIEAMACGTPVLAYNKGGSVETVIDKFSGLLFPEQKAESIISCIYHFETIAYVFDAKKISAYAQKFSTARFKREFHSFVERKTKDFFEPINDLSQTEASSISHISQFDIQPNKA